MPRYNSITNSFQYGELSPKFLARTDTEQYQKGAGKIENLIVLPSGGVTRRPGSVRITERALANAGGALIDSRLICFSFSKDEEYGIWLFINSDGDLGALAYRPSSYQSATLGATVTAIGHAVAGAWAQGELKDIHYVQSGDFVIFSHGSHPPVILRRLASNSFSFGSYLSFVAINEPNPGFDVLNRPYRDANVTTTTLTVSNYDIGTGRTLTASAALFDAGMDAPGTAAENATFFKVTIGAITGVFRVTAYVSTTQVTGDVVIAFNSAGASGTNSALSDDWQESSWSTYRGWPAAVGIFESRLIFGGNTAQPDTVWGSLVFNFFIFMQTVLAQDVSATVDTSGLGYFRASIQDIDPFAFTPSAKEVNRVNWIQSGRTLTIGTLGQEFVATSGTDRVLSANSVSFTDQTTVGSNKVQAIRVNKSTVFVSRDGKKIYQYSYENLSQSYVADSLTAISDQIVIQTKLDELDLTDTTTFNDPISSYQITELHWQGTRSCLWAVTNSGHLIGLTWDPQVKALGWHRHIFGGFSDGEKTVPARVISASVVTSADGAIDNLWVIIHRMVNGIDYHSLEIIGPDYQYKHISSSHYELPIYMDSAIAITNLTASETVSGLDHLAGETVDVIADNFYHPQCQVDALSGSITLNREASVILVGLPYTPRLKLAPLEAGSPIGSGQGMMTRVDRMTIRFYRTIRAIVNGPEQSEKVLVRDGSNWNGTPLATLTGDKKVNVPMGPETRCELEITQDQPFPMTILGVVLRGQLNE